LRIYQEVSDKAKKLYAYLTYFAGGKGYAWPSFNHLAAKLHVSRRYVIKLVQELSAHGLIAATNVAVPAKGHCTKHRFLWHPWVQTVEDGDFRMVVREEKPPFRAAESGQSTATPSEQQITSPSELEDTSPGEPQIAPLVIPSSPKENNRKRTNDKGTVPVTFSKTVTLRPPEKTASPPPRDLSDATKIILERRIAELRKEIATAVRKDLHDRATQLHKELVAHRTKLGFTPDGPPAQQAASC
jgi:Helix-turn-helix domain